MTDELKPVNCGCGGEAVAIGDDDNNIYFVKCNKCWISTNLFYSEAEAVQAWNRAMGSTEKSSTVERTAKAGYSNADGEYLCSECGRVVQIEDAYCCGCGARLEWE